MTRDQGSPGTPGREAEDVPVDGEGPADSSKVEQDIADLLSETEQQRDEYLELAQRTKADFENYRKRMAAEVAAAGLRGKATLADGLIDAVDNLERALAAAGIDPDGAELEDGFAHGVRLVYLGMRETLARTGIEPVDPAGEKFDPQLHEALQKVPVEGTEPGFVVEVVQKGYRIEDHLIRPARVVVSE